ARICHSTQPLFELRNACSRPTLEPMTRDPLNSSSGTRLIVETDPRPEDIRFLEDRLYEFNVQATGSRTQISSAYLSEPLMDRSWGALLAGRGEEPVTSA